MDELDLQECTSSLCQCDECQSYSESGAYKPWIKSVEINSNGK